MDEKKVDVHFDTPTFLLYDWNCFYCIIPMHEVVPKVVAIAVRMVMTNWMIFCQSSFFIVMSY